MEIRVGTKLILKTGDEDFSFSGLRIASTRSSQTGRYLRAAGVKKFDRGNVETIIGLTVTQLHDAIEDAEVFLMEHELDVPNVANVTISAVALSGARIRRYLQNASVDVIDIAMMGKTTMTTYRISGGEILKQNPGTNSS